ncbi:MAG: aminoacyl-tRNA deacylase [Candidatus Korarchaeota archaeon]|nr:aminoacyl-tRNA deacylase [Candidatus Korarchaeota archaeon]
MTSDFESLVEELGGRLITTRGEVKTVRQAARELGVEEEQIIKTLVVITDEGPVLAILDGRSRLDLSKLGRGARLASPREVEEHTGYRVGEVPPVGIPLRTLVDERVLRWDRVYGGGGSIRRLVELDPRAIVRYQKAEVGRLRI